jgi:drug/metabolite transporter (DMT)-like permease
MYSLLDIVYIISIVIFAAMIPYSIMGYAKNKSFINLAKVIFVFTMYTFILCQLFNRKYTLLSLSIFLKVLPLLVLSFISFYILHEQKPTFKKVLALSIIVVGLFIFELSDE